MASNADKVRISFTPESLALNWLQRHKPEGDEICHECVWEGLPAYWNEYEVCSGCDHCFARHCNCAEEDDEPEEEEEEEEYGMI